MGQPDHLGRVTQTSLWFQATHPEITSTRYPSCYSPVDVSSHCVVQHRAKTAAEAGRGRPSLLAGATGPAPLLRGCGPGCQRQRSQVRVARSAGMAGLSHSLLSNGPALLGKREGPGSQQPRVRTSSCQSQLLAAIWAGAVPVSQICLPFGKRGENCAAEIASPSILRLSVKNPTKPAFEKRRDEKCHVLGCFQRNLLLLGPLHPRKISICPRFPLVLSFYLVITFTFKN